MKWILVLWLFGQPIPERPCIPILSLKARSGEIVVIYSCPICRPGVPCPEIGA